MARYYIHCYKLIFIHDRIRIIYLHYKQAINFIFLNQKDWRKIHLPAVARPRIHCWRRGPVLIMKKINQRQRDYYCFKMGRVAWRIIKGTRLRRIPLVTRQLICRRFDSYIFPIGKPQDYLSNPTRLILCVLSCTRRNFSTREVFGLITPPPPVCAARTGPFNFYDARARAQLTLPSSSRRPRNGSNRNNFSRSLQSSKNNKI